MRARTSRRWLSGFRGGRQRPRAENWGNPNAGRWGQVRGAPGVCAAGRRMDRADPHTAGICGAGGDATRAGGDSTAERGGTAGAGGGVKRRRSSPRCGPVRRGCGRKRTSFVRRDLWTPARARTAARAPVFSAYAHACGEEEGGAGQARLDHGRTATGSTAGAAGHATAGSAAAKDERAGSRGPNSDAGGELCQRREDQGGWPRAERAEEGFGGGDRLRAGPAELRFRPRRRRRWHLAQTRGWAPPAACCPRRARRLRRSSKNSGNLAAKRRPTLAPKAAARKKTRYDDRAPIEDKARRDTAKAAKAKEKAAATTGSNGDRRGEGGAADAVRAAGTEWRYGGQEKEEAGERRSEGAAAGTGPRAAQAQARGDADSAQSVRENGEPVVSPPPAVPAVTVPADAQPSEPAGPAAAK